MHNKEQESINKIVLKKCNQCGIEKEHTAEFFHKSNQAKSGLISKCKECRNNNLRKEKGVQNSSLLIIPTKSKAGYN